VLHPIFKARSEIAALVQATLAVDIKH